MAGWSDMDERDDRLEARGEAQGLDWYDTWTGPSDLDVARASRELSEALGELQPLLDQIVDAA